MSCETVQKLLSAFLDARLRENEMNGVSRHLAECRVCAVEHRLIADLRDELRAMPPAPAPPDLASRVLVTASRERAHRLAAVAAGSATRLWLAELREKINALIRPIAVPAFGGLASAFMLFGLVVPSLGVPRYAGLDVPTPMYTEATLIEMAPVNVTEDLVVEFTIDERGRIADYAITQGRNSRETADSMRNLMLYASFTPATWFGQPTLGKILFAFQRSRIVVKG